MAEPYGLSPLQQGMLFHLLFEPGSGADIEQLVMRFDEDVDATAWVEAWMAAADRHEVLRTSFVPNPDGEPTQVVHPAAPMELVEIDHRAYTEAQAEERLRRFLARDRARGFDPERAPLSRLTSFRRSSGAATVVWSFHHIILDGRSFPIVLADVFAAYDAARAGHAIRLAPSVPYRRFIEALDGLDREAAADYWRKTLAGFTAPTPLGVVGIGGIDPSASGVGEVAVEVDADTTGRLAQLAEAAGVTVNTTLQATWARLLSIYSGESDVVFGATRSGRYGTIDEATTMAGLFINTLPMRIAVPPEAPVMDWLRDVRAQHLALRDHEHTPLVEVQALSEVRSGTRLFDSILVFENRSTNEVLQERTGVGGRVEFELLEQTNHPLLLSAYGGDRLELRLEFDRSMFDPAVAERMAGHVATLLRSLVERPNGTVGELVCLDADEARVVVEQWGAGPSAPPASDLVSRWRRRVAETPDAPAVIDDRNRVSFAELDERSETLACELGRRGAGPGHVVGILLDRSVDAVAAMLAVLKCGAAYLPLDTGYPPDRLRYMIADAGARVVLVGARQAADGPLAEVLRHFHDLAVVNVDEPAAADRDPAPSAGSPPIAGGSPAYVLYTSGSTGTPKGVVVSHASLTDRADGLIDAYGLGPDDRVLQFAALSFDVAAEELYPTWLAGAAVVLRTDAAATDLEELGRIVDDHAVTVLNLPAAYWATWVDHLATGGEVGSGSSVPAPVRLVVTGSEPVSTAHYRRWSSLVDPSVRWLAAYGPTEATVTASVFDPVGSDPPPGPIVPIGRPLANTVLRILDDGGRPVPIGVAGELSIGGQGVAIGYHERPELTMERFVADPLGPPGARLYRTGDRARWLPDGNVEFLGRIDDQVKVRGFRVELGEIEAALTELDEVAQAAVVARPDAAGNDQLVAHVVADGSLTERSPADVPDGVSTEAETELDLDGIRRRLGRRLPGYMVPVAIARAESLPLTPSGKIDRAALPDIDLAPSDRPSPVAPRTDLERRLAAIWTDVLGSSAIGVHDDFFDLGGNSLTAIRLFSAVASATGRRLSLPELFAAPTVAELAAALGDPEGGQDQGHGVGHGGDHRPGDVPSWVVPVKVGGSRPPLFHLGGASVLRSLAEHLPEDQPLYALLEQDLDADHFATTVEEIVPHCLAGLRAVQPTGPYHLAGLCFGGVVALEMSRRLRSHGEEVGLTVMIDSFAPGAADVRARLEHDGEPAGAGVIDRPPGAASKDLSGASRSAADRYHPRRLVQKARLHAWRAGWGPLHAAFRRLGRPMPDWLRDVEEANTIAADAYCALPYDGDVTLLKATDNVEDLDAGPCNGWDDLIEGELTVVEVAGGHISMYREPRVAGLAAALTARLEAVQPASTVPAGREERS